ncbi:hypothetical protein JYT74_01765 [Crocinitomix catalasitica]|nr:hypothetical protein [Crocinitomix catalasitica]
MTAKQDPFDSLTETVTASMDEIISFKENIKRCEATIEDLTNQNSKLNNDLKQANNQISILNDESIQLKSDLKKEKDNVSSLNETNKTLEASIKSLEEEKSDLSGKLEQALNAQKKSEE